MDEVESIESLIRSKNISVDEALLMYECKAKHICEGDLSNLKVDILDCGFPSLNDMMIFKKDRGDLIILGARPGQGKSALMFQIASHVAELGNVLIFSLEMDFESIKARMVAGLTGRGLSNLLLGHVNKDELNRANQRLSELSFYVDDRSALDVETIYSSALNFHKIKPLSLVVVDYCQIIKTKSRHSRAEEIGDITGTLKSLAKMIRAPVILGSQLSRENERRGTVSGNFKPMLSDLRDSGSLEADADSIIFIHRQETYDGSRPGEADIKVAKNRNGMIGEMVFKWFGAATKFKDSMEEIL